MTLHEKLSLIQRQFKSKKSRYNSFGKYYFRSAEDILEALKPFNKKYNVYFTVSEKLDSYEKGSPPVLVVTASVHNSDPGKFYKSDYGSETVMLSMSADSTAAMNTEGADKVLHKTTKDLSEFDAGEFRWENIEDQTNVIRAHAIVGVDLNQKGMQTPQQFGSASSYGKKYALGNLLLIDDTADSDATNTHGKSGTSASSKEAMSEEQFEKAKVFLQKGGKLSAIEKKYTLTDDQRTGLS